MPRCRSLVLPVLALLLGVGLLLPGCAGRRVAVPPAIDLAAVSTVGLVEFTCNEEGDLAGYTTRRFLEYVLADQPQARIVELGSQEALLGEVGREEMDLEAIRAIGERYGLNSLIVGRLEVEDIQPKVNLSTILSSLSVRAEVEARLNARLLETASSATLWSGSSRGKETVGEVHVFSGGAVFFDADDPEEAYGDLVEGMLNLVTRDFRVTWQRVKGEGR